MAPADSDTGGGASHESRAAGGITSDSARGSANTSNTCARGRGTQKRRSRTWSVIGAAAGGAGGDRSGLRELLHFREDLVGSRQLTPRVSLDEPDDALL